MQKKGLIIGFTVIMLVFTGCQDRRQNGAGLDIIYKQYEKDNSIGSVKQFFYSFPDSFKDLQKLYGFDDVKGPSLYYEDYGKHIALFFKAPAYVDGEVFAKKIIKISINGKWYADAVNYFQSDLRDYFFNHKAQMLALLDLRQNKEIESFWYFFSDGPHFNDEVSKNVLAALKNNSKMLGLYLQAIEQVKNDNIH